VLKAAALFRTLTLVPPEEEEKSLLGKILHPLTGIGKCCCALGPGMIIPDPVFREVSDPRILPLTPV
jgi:hypothetical protein